MNDPGSWKVQVNAYLQVTLIRDGVTEIAQPVQALIDKSQIEAMYDSYSGEGTVIRCVSGSTYTASEDLSELAGKL